MIARRFVKTESRDWVTALREAYTDPALLLQDLGLTSADTGYEPAMTVKFDFRVPRAYARRMNPGRPNDPLLRQVLPHRAENTSAQGFNADPVGDLAAMHRPGLLKKYHGRALLLLTGACAVNCRYCFRREFPYQGLVGSPQLSAGLADIASDPSIREVILSGGDPLMLKDAPLSELLQRLESIPHLLRLRIHTRLPLVLPARVTPALLTALARTRLQTVLVMHVNHAQEIDEAVITASRALTEHRVTLLNQSVLLRGVNDDAAVLAALSEQLFVAGILPYYLHMLDRVSGAAHFEVEEKTAVALHQDLMGLLPGFLVPRLVREVAGAPYKMPLR